MGENVTSSTNRNVHPSVSFSTPTPSKRTNFSEHTFSRNDYDDDQEDIIRYHESPVRRTPDRPPSRHFQEHHPSQCPTPYPAQRQPMTESPSSSSPPSGPKRLACVTDGQREETLNILCEIADCLQTGLSRPALDSLWSLLVHDETLEPDALAMAIRELRQR